MRYTRQDLKQDKFVETAAGAAHWTSEHRQKIVSATIVIVALVLIIVGGFWYFGYRNDQAAKEFGSAMAIYNAPVVPAGTVTNPQIVTYPDTKSRDIAAKKAFYEVSSRYGGVKSAVYAHYFAAMCEQNLGNAKIAEDQFKSVSSSGNKDIAGLANFALASIYRGNGNDAEAIKIYKDLIDHPANLVPKASAQLQLAEIYSAKQPDEAKKLYAQISKDNPKSAAKELADAKLAALK